MIHKNDRQTKFNQVQNKPKENSDIRKYIPR